MARRTPALSPVGRASVLPPALQTTLLGVLERREFERVGGFKDIEFDIRVVSATNRDLRSDVNRESFALQKSGELGPLQKRSPSAPSVAARRRGRRW
jgi:transcriptional regulator of acetoin/glycerol metabolism